METLKAKRHYTDLIHELQKITDMLEEDIQQMEAVESDNEYKDDELSKGIDELASARDCIYNAVNCFKKSL